ncbi:Deoxyribodipyrimidine photo-lyase [Thalassocella blandensis]|nr:Deoxyribodipyrimidine photo-lyase [Thalassocella blandensis]
MHLVWLRNDIRLDDNPALYQAAKSCNKAVTQQKMCAVYIATPKQWQIHDEAPAKLGLRSQALNDVRKNLGALGIPLYILETPKYAGIPALLQKFCDEHEVTDCWWNEEIPIDEKERDKAVAAHLQHHAVTTHECKSNRIVNHTLLNQQESPYKVFTPWYKSWVKHLALNIDLPHAKPDAVGKALKVDSSPIVLPGSDDFRSDLWPAAEKDALQRLETFVFEREQSYMQHRDIPSLNGTSTISPYLASGMISSRRCLAMIMQACGEQGRDWQGDDWLRELAWREFYYYLMQCFPKLCRNRAFKPETENLQWEKSAKALAAWQQGNTGFPIVDAGMRQLNQTGWMHNRLRMVTASFLTKLLLIDWREGERYFMQHLIDGDFASNNGGWQWSASTGCDASPWFRIFNPYSQSQKFDPEGKFIKKFVPELKDLNAKDIHNPPSKVRQHLKYPEPVVDYKFARERVLARFKELK